MVLDKIVYMNTNEYKASVKQVGGALQVNDVTVTAKTRQQLKERLRDTLVDVLDVLSDLNKEMDKENGEKKKVNKTITTMTRGMK